MSACALNQTKQRWAKPTAQTGKAALESPHQNGPAVCLMHGPVHVVDDGREIGVVSSEDVLALIAGEHSPEMGD